MMTGMKEYGNRANTERREAASTETDSVGEKPSGSQSVLT